MAGQVDIIISQKAIDEIKNATAELDTLHRKILAVNSAGAKSTTGIGNNQAIVKEIEALNKLIAANNTATQSIINKALANKRGTIATEESTRAIQNKTKSIIGVNSALKAMGILLIAQKVKEFALHIFSLAKTFDSLKFALEKTSKNIAEANMNMRFMLKISTDLGLDLVSTTSRFIKFAAAAKNSGVAMKDTQKIFGTMAKAGAVLGLRTDELGGIFLALEQMLSKGKVTTEELRRQLGERLPGAFGIMAASLGVTLPKLDEMLKKGEVLSAEVLPGFADAVEVAFGLDTVDKIDTLVAAENRMITAWQNFVKGITEGDSIIKKVFKSILEIGEQLARGLDKIFNSESFFKNKMTQTWFDAETKAIKDNASDILEFRRKNGDNLAKIDADIAKAKKKVDKNINDEIAEDELRLAVERKLHYNTELHLLEQEDASKRFAQRYAQVEEDENKIIELKKKIEDVGLPWEKRINKKGKFNHLPIMQFIILRNDEQSKRYKDLNEQLERANKNLQKHQAILDATRLIATKSKEPEKEKEDPDKNQKKLRLISDLKRKIQIGELEQQIAFNNKVIEADETSIENRLRLLEVNTGKLREILALELADTIENIEAKSAEEKKGILKSIADKKTGAVEGAKFIADLEIETADKIKLAQQKSADDIFKINEKLIDEKIKGVSDEVKKTLKLKQMEFDIVENLAKEDFAKRKAVWEAESKNKGKIFEESKIGANEKIKLDNKITDNSIEASNARIDILVAEKNALMSTAKGSEEFNKGLLADIAALNASRPGGRDKSGKKLLDKKDQLDLDLEYLEKYSNAVADIGNSIFDRKIAQIDAEIQANQDKYTTLFALAEGDSEQQRLLAIQQEKDREKLEKKKRKAQREQAIFNKAQAIVDIAINTAVAISRAPAEGLIFGLAMIPVIAALGALQAAAVLAQPLPAFADGGTMTHDGPALVGDGGKHEVVRTPDGKVILTPNTDTVMNLPKGSEIFPSVDKFNSQAPSDMSSLLHSSTLLASISLNQKNIDGMLMSQRELDERMLDEMIRNTKAVKNSQSNTFVKTQKIDIPHELWKSKYLS